MDRQDSTVLVKRVGCNVILCTKNALKIITLRPVQDSHHKLIHTYERDSSSSFKTLRRILKDPKKALKLRGSKKVNLIMLLAIRESNNVPGAFAGVFEDILIGRSQDTKLGTAQKKILKLLTKNSKLLKKLLYKNPRVFLDFIKIFNIKNLSGFEKEIKILREVEKHANKSRDHYGLPLRLHCDFCLENTNSTLIFFDEYQKMIDGIRRRKPYNSLIKESEFYPEIMLYNDFMLSKVNQEFFDRELLNRSFVTDNEILVRNYVKRQVQKKK
ncbi:uncharacterized protein VICG_01363 [Vittaforma corneae ATCC 50505]|uniref:Uncharacterized protein n=1 Tax=Vittaforma corneae (strain ATCC 50505) TaxID=993615 RepID=L2GMB3_VITCO|nr:uncharacterized protein VICG_01363 [Vittaforma corneae ATCC 50505]ELA41615.1 hypothetical protein VICG_01363 [Vittaforma corneae ATCC 50505]